MNVSGVQSFGRSYASKGTYSGLQRKYVNGIVQQQEQNKKNVGKVALALTAIAAAIAFRKPLGKALTPVKKFFSEKMPNFSEAAKSVKDRAGRIFKPMKANTEKWVNDNIPKAKKGVSKFWQKVKKAADSDLKEKVHKAPDIIYQGAGAPRPLLPPGV
ncbi:hypothetical protein IKQ26_02370 [bacterium]|nr:hypothetical protein [bacterium]